MDELNVELLHERLIRAAAEAHMAGNPDNSPDFRGESIKDCLVNITRIVDHIGRKDRFFLVPRHIERTVIEPIRRFAPRLKRYLEGKQHEYRAAWAYDDHTDSFGAFAFDAGPNPCVAMGLPEDWLYQLAKAVERFKETRR